ncbi:molybdenum cofactor guanylyltransferase [Metabacillus herbersteinensis]|uniref:Probable molybdenum cofactor guanylyltransferase n=1 Tax=Metabacillus herbersteinensis TaxID=283816 RepID=A0ABV6GAM9_9BACI
MKVETVGVLLAGGESRRFGSPKAFSQYNGIPFFNYSLKAIEGITEKQVIISHPSLVQQFSVKTDLPIFTDEEKFKGKGPLAGIYTAMKQVKAEWYVVLSCDIPRITPEVVNRLVCERTTDHQAIIPIINGNLQPLIGVYHHSVYKIIEQLLHDKSYKVMLLLNQVNVRYLNEVDLKTDKMTFENINTQQDLNQLEKK